MNNPPKILVDSNVWIDSYLGYRANHDASLDFLRTARRCQAALMYGVTKLETIFYVLANEMKKAALREGRTVDEKAANACRAFAWGCIENIRELACAVGADEADVWLATKYRSISDDFEDNILLAAAQRVAVDYLVTTDRVLLNKATVAALAPQDMLTVLEAKL